MVGHYICTASVSFAFDFHLPVLNTAEELARRFARHLTVLCVE